MDLVNRSLRWLMKNQRPSIGSNLVMVNLGCGMAVAPGWVNIDGSPNALVANLPGWIHPFAYRFSGARKYYSREDFCGMLGNGRFVYHDLKYGIPFDDGTVDFCYSSHFLEHLERKAAQRLIDEMFRVLKPGGAARIAVPDLEHAWSMYHKGNKEQMLSDFFFVEHPGDYSKHRWAYDFELLSKAMAKAGFADVARMGCGQGSAPDLERLDNRAEYTLFVEGTKPGS